VPLLNLINRGAAYGEDFLPYGWDFGRTRMGDTGRPVKRMGHQGKLLGDPREIGGDPGWERCSTETFLPKHV
jgi:hypothetical protein